MIFNFRLNLEENRTKFLKPIEGNWKMRTGWAERSPDRTVQTKVYSRVESSNVTILPLNAFCHTADVSIRQSISLPTEM